MVDRPNTVVLPGIGISPGLAVGEVFLYRNPVEADVPRYPIAPDRVADELARLDAAIQGASAELQSVSLDVARHMDAELAAIFDAHDQILQDPMAREELRQEIESTYINAECAVQRVFRKWERRFLEMDLQRAQAHAGDIADLGRRLLRGLCGTGPEGLQDGPLDRVVAARRLLPSEAVQLPMLAARAVVVEEGGSGSHFALLTRAMGIPAVIQGAGFLSRIRTGDLLMVDGDAGSVVVHPSPDLVRRCEDQAKLRATRSARAQAACREAALTRDGEQVLVLANIASQADAVTAARNGADGVGLYRLEMFYLGRSSFPSEQELYEELAGSARLFPSSMFCVRLLDLGGDKSLSFLEMPTESNPNLGRRGVRFLFAYPELLRTQLRAVLRLTQERQLFVLTPMVTLPDDVRRIRDLLASEAANQGWSKLPELGPMIETPAAALSMEQLVPLCDFFSIGTNDLTQYIMAADRENPLVDAYFQDAHPIIIDVIRKTVAQAQGKLIGVCGELAGKDEGIPLLLRAGIRVLSVAPPFVPRVKQVVRQSSALSAPV
jgi:phosphoenolpyruvate-protein phosphotransferase